MYLYRNFVKQHKNELVLDGLTVVRLDGYEEDCFWVVTGMKGTYEISCAHDLTILKGKIRLKDYKRMLMQFNMNLKQ